MKPPLTRKDSYSLQKYSIRSEILKCLHSRRMLIIICSLVVLECAIVMSEVIVDLYRIRARFKNEEEQIKKFVNFVQTKHPDLYSKFEDRTLGEVLHMLQHTAMVWDPSMDGKCECPHSDHDDSRPRGKSVKHLVRKRDIVAQPLFTVSEDMDEDFLTRDENLDDVFDNHDEDLNDVFDDLSNDGGEGNGERFNSSINVVAVEGLGSEEAIGQLRPSPNDKVGIKKEDKDNDKDTQSRSERIGLSKFKLSGDNEENPSVTSDKSYGLHKQSPVKLGMSFGTYEHTSSSQVKHTRIIRSSEQTEHSVVKEGRIKRSYGEIKQSNVIEDMMRRSSDEIKQLNVNQNRNRRRSDVKQEIIRRNSDEIKQSNVIDDMIRRRSERVEGALLQNCSSIPDVFILSVSSDATNYYLVAEFLPLHERNISESVERDIETFQKEYKKYSGVSNILAYIGFTIFSIMLLEIVVKLACLGLRCFKKKIDVFDAFIVIVSFALDALFLDSRWYESGKGATTVVVLLLPWRIVHIVNGFLMTIKHKHHIEIMTIRRSKKKCETKVSKLKELVLALRRDVDLLVNLCKLKGATGPEITACIYGKGRNTATLAAITSFASLMFISTLGKPTPCDVDVSDDLYGDIIRDILDDVDDDDDDDDVNGNESDAEKRTASIRVAKDDNYIEEDLDDLEHGGIYTVTQSLRKSSPRRKAKSKFAAERRATMPRRHLSYVDDEGGCSYVNDGYVTCDETRRGTTGSCATKKVVKSLPSLLRDSSPGNDSFLTFEVRTQVSYL